MIGGLALLVAAFVGSGVYALHRERQIDRAVGRHVSRRCLRRLEAAGAFLDDRGSWETDDGGPELHHAWHDLHRYPGCALCYPSEVAE
jgi:hypothetical protein